MKPSIRNSFLMLAVSVAMLALAGKASAQTQIFFENFDTDQTANWTITERGGSNWANVYMDYSLLGVPAAPHSTNGTTHGILLQANLDPATGVFPTGITVAPNGFGISDNFEMHWDMWLNYVKSGLGSSQIAGGGYGTSGTFANVAGSADCVSIGAITDVNTAGFRVYSPGKNVSYQGGAYVLGSGFNCGESFYHPGDPISGFVYAGTGGSRNSANIYYTTNFPGGNSPTLAQQILHPFQTNSPLSPFVSSAGSISFQWHDVALKKVGSRITYRIDGILIATVDDVDATIGECGGGVAPGETNTVPSAFLGGSNIMFNMYDINAGASTDPDGPSTIFALVDNVRITNFPTVVTVTAITPSAAEQGTVPGVYRITRTSSGAPLTVDFTLTGTATSNVDYTIDITGGSVTFGATDTTTNITVTPIDDAIVEPTEVIVLTLNDSTNFIGSGSAFVSIADNETPELSITNVSTGMYERTNDFATFQVTRLGNTNAASFNVNLGFGGTATANTDYYAESPVTFNPGDITKTFKIFPLEDSLLEGTETVRINVAAGTGYTVASPGTTGAVNIVDATLPTENVLFSDNFNTDTSGSWTTKYAAFNGLDDYLVVFNYDYSADFIPPAPHSAGDTRGLKLTVNKASADPLGAAALNLYPNGRSFSNDIALRFDMYLINGGGGSATEYALAGINHSGNKTNWFRSGGVPAGWTFDGLFFDIETDNGAAASDYALYTAQAAASNAPLTLLSSTAAGFTGIFKAPPWSVAGLPANLFTTTTPIWADVEVKQVNNVVTLKVNNTQILNYTNTGTYKVGNIMLGYVDAFDSVGPANASVIFDNVRVVTARDLQVTGTQIVGSNLRIDFADDASNGPWTLLSSATVSTNSADYTSVSATFSTVSPGNYRMTTPYNKTEFSRVYRVRRN